MKNQFLEKHGLAYQKMNKSTKHKLEINEIIVRKMNYLKNDAELDGRWSNLMVENVIL